MANIEHKSENAKYKFGTVQHALNLYSVTAMWGSLIVSVLLALKLDFDAVLFAILFLAIFHLRKRGVQ